MPVVENRERHLQVVVWCDCDLKIRTQHHCSCLPFFSQHPVGSATYNYSFFHPTADSPAILVMDDYESRECHASPTYMDIYTYIHTYTYGLAHKITNTYSLIYRHTCTYIYLYIYSCYSHQTA